MGCLLCGINTKDNKSVETLVGSICKPCLMEALNIQNITSVKNKIGLRPYELKEKLDEFVIGQDCAKEMLTVELCNHIFRCNSNNSELFPKNNMLFIGNSGVGKTYMIETVLKVLKNELQIDIPFVVSDATELTETGYVGKDVSGILKSLIDRANGDIELAQKGIIYIDEVDKLNRNSGREVGGEGVQQALLTMMNGTVMDLTSSKGALQIEENISIDTSNILFICGGAFEGIDKIIKNRLNVKQSMGFKAYSNTDDVKKESIDIVDTNDLIKYGMAKEFVGRLPLVSRLSDLSKNDLKSILLNSKNSLIEKYKMIFTAYGIDVKFENDFIDLVIEESYKYNTGARSLNSIMSKHLNPIIYKCSSTNNTVLNINKELIEKK